MVYGEGLQRTLTKRRSTGSINVRAPYADNVSPISPIPFSASTDQIHLIRSRSIRRTQYSDYGKTFLDLDDHDYQMSNEAEENKAVLGHSRGESVYDDLQYEDIVLKRSQAQQLADSYMEELEDFCQWSGSSKDLKTKIAKQGSEPVQDMIREIDRALTMNSASFDDDELYSEQPRLTDTLPLRRSTQTRRASAYAPQDKETPKLRRTLSRRTSSFGNPAEDPSIQSPMPSIDLDELRRPSVAESLHSIRIALVRDSIDNRRLQARRLQDAPDSMVFLPPRRINPRGPIHSSFPDSPTDPWKALPPLPPEAYQEEAAASPFVTRDEFPKDSPQSPRSAPLSLYSDVGLSDSSSVTSGSLNEPCELHSPEKEVAPIEERISYHEDMGKEVVPEAEPVVSCRIESVATLDFPEFLPDDDDEEEEDRAQYRVSDVSGDYNYYGGRNSPQLPSYPQTPRDALGISRELMQQKWVEEPGVSMPATFTNSRSRPGTPDTFSSRSSSPETHFGTGKPRLSDGFDHNSYRRRAAENSANVRISPPLGSFRRPISPPVYNQSWGMI